MAEFMMLSKGSFQEWKRLSPEEAQNIMERYHCFVDGLKKENRFKGGSALREGSFHFRHSQGKVLMDGPYTETKEAITGYLFFSAEGIEEASEIARRCPALFHGETVELLQLT